MSDPAIGDLGNGGDNGYAGRQVNVIRGSISTEKQQNWEQVEKKFDNARKKRIWAIMQGSALGFKAKKTPFDGLRGMALNYHWRYTKHQLAKRIMLDLFSQCVDVGQ